MNMCVSASVCVSCAFFLWLFFLLVCFVLVLVSEKTTYCGNSYTAEHFIGVGVQFYV